MHQVSILKKAYNIKKSVHSFVLTNSASLFQGGGLSKVLPIFLTLPYIDKNQFQLDISMHYYYFFLLILPILNIFSWLLVR